MIRNCKPFWQNVLRNDCTVWTVFMGYTNPLCNVLSCVQGWQIGSVVQWYMHRAIELLACVQIHGST